MEAEIRTKGKRKGSSNQNLVLKTSLRSLVVNSRHVPTSKKGNRKAPILTRTNLSVGSPTEAVIFRT
jgi:hypothetical protein